MHKLMIVTMVLIGACGGTGAVSLDDYQAARRDAVCQYLVKCGNLESVDTCRANFGSVFGRFSASDRAAFDMGKAMFDGAAAATCLDAIATRSCDTTSRSARVLPDACDQIASGTLAGGASCAQDIECSSLHCDVPACNLACCTGTCGGDAPVTAKLGESCASAKCDSTSYCDAKTTTCIALQPEGAACASESACDFGLACVIRDGGQLCAALPKLGEACTDYCREQGTTCSATTKTCAKQGNQGAACMTSLDCSLFYFCDTTNQCTSDRVVGTACHFGDVCAGAGFCDAPSTNAMGTCVLPKADGAPCQRNSDCDSQSCDPATLVCGPEPVCI